MDLSFLSPAQKAIASDVIEQCAMSRSWYVENVLGVERVETWQRDVLEDLDYGVRKLSIRSGHGVGKTALCSWVGSHFLLFRSDVKIIVTSPSLRQLKDGLYPEVNKWLRKAPYWMTRSLDITSERIVRKPDTENNFMSFRTARKENPEAFAGVHAENVMVLVDEASGVDEIVYETGQGALSTEGAIAILIGNPTNPTGFFYKTHHELSNEWKTYKVSCMDSSRVDQSYIDSQAVTYGVDSRAYKVRVLGEFPDSSEDQMIPRSFAEGALDRAIEEDRDGRVWGLDPGTTGDASGFVERSNNAVLAVEELRYADLMALVGWVKTRWDMTGHRYRPNAIYVDCIGLGAGVADRLMELQLPVVPVNVAELASMSDRYIRLKPELWMECRRWLEPRDVTFSPARGERPELTKQLVEELCQPRLKILPKSGKIDVESKDEMRSRGIKSPNLAEALVITFAHGGAVQGGATGGYTWPTNVDTKKYRAPGVK